MTGIINQVAGLGVTALKGTYLDAVSEREIDSGARIGVNIFCEGQVETDTCANYGGEADTVQSAKSSGVGVVQCTKRF